MPPRRLAAFSRPFEGCLMASERERRGFFRQKTRPPSLSF
jgi:hypothetical protein